jgi:hypothetical protein
VLTICVADGGGIFRHAFGECCAELQSARLLLFVPTPNAARRGTAAHSAWMPNPAAVSALDIAAFEFVGMLLGYALRSKNFMNLSLVPLFWKLIVHEPVTVADLFDINDATISELQMLEVHLPAGTAASLLDSVGQVSCRVVCVITTVLCANPLVALTN